MTNKKIFNFDISVSADKKRRKNQSRGMSGVQETSRKICQHPKCEQPGKYRAPLNPGNLDAFRWFCLTHIRQFNQKWNFFNNQSKLNNNFENPPKKSADQRIWERLGVDDPQQVLGSNATLNPGKGNALGGNRQLSTVDRKAITILEASETWTKNELRKQYRALIKELHPDLNGGDRSHEQRLQEVVWAWEQISNSRTI